MKRLIFLFYMLTFSSLAAQDHTHNANLIILVDDEVCIGSIANIEITGEGSKVDAQYDPGNMIIARSDYEKLTGNKSNYSLSFDYYQYKGKKQKLYNYELPFSVDWLDQAYVVLRIYNLDKKKYRKLYEPLDQSKNYTFEYDYPGGSMKRVSKK